ncbi:MAG: phosphate acyltransferase PlsX [Actinomycetia bacterium]|nr:phosphate acyltransferase PlsX [Actinomycetes bacterium]
MENNSKKYSIVVDAMGGDLAPGEIIKGALLAQEKSGVKTVLVGNRGKITASASENNLDISGLEIINSRSEVSMDESPSDVIRNKKDSSLYIGSRLVHEGKGGALLSAGNTGAAMACSLFNIKRIKGVLRPAIAIVIPLAGSKCVLIDGGANADCKPQYLAQFAIMGKVYAENILGIRDPGIGLVNIGGEEKKGNELAIESHRLIKDIKGLNFKGNIEGREIFEGHADIVVTDGFTGNVILKVFEGLAKMFFGEVREALTSSIASKIAALVLKKPLTAMKNKFDYETYGGAQLLGLNAPVVISHGSSRARAIKNAVCVAQESLKADLVDKIEKEIKTAIN